MLSAGRLTPDRTALHAGNKYDNLFLRKLRLWPEPPSVRQYPSAAVVTKAALRAAALLGLSNKVLARIVGLSEASVSRMGTGAYLLTPGDKSFELAVLFVRLYRSLDAIVMATKPSRAAWLTNENAALGGTPLAADPDGPRPGRYACLPGRPPRSRLNAGGCPARAGAWSRRSTACRR